LTNLVNSDYPALSPRHNFEGPMPRKPSVVREAVSLYDAKTHLSALVERAHSGEEIVIMKSGRARARLVPMDAAPALRVPGRGKGAWRVTADFDAPLPDDVLDTFEGTS
jgi:prevent-host-death family protein